MLLRWAYAAALGLCCCAGLMLLRWAYAAALGLCCKIAPCHLEPEFQVEVAALRPEARIVVRECRPERPKEIGGPQWAQRGVDGPVDLLAGAKNAAAIQEVIANVNPHALHDLVADVDAELGKDGKGIATV